MRGSKGWIVDSLVPRSLPSFPLFVVWKSGIQELGEGGWVDGFLVQWIPAHSDQVRKGLGNNLVRSVLLGFSLLPRPKSSITQVLVPDPTPTPAWIAFSIPRVIVEAIYAPDEVWGQD